MTPQNNNNLQIYSTFVGRFSSMQFKNIIGQQAIKDRLMGLIKENRLPHALLLWGNEGIGKLALAIALAQYLLCENRQDIDACDECLSCKQIKKLIHPDLHFVFPIVKKTTEPICDDFLEDWREMITQSPYFSYQQWMDKIGDGKQGQIYSRESEEILRKLNYKSFQGEFKAMIIWLPEKMNAICANKLLKLLEEPPEKTYFILVSEQPEQLLTTISSRTQMIHVPGIATEDLQPIVGEEIARVANGNYIKAMLMQQQAGESKTYFDLYRNLMLMVVRHDVLGVKQWAEQLHEMGREEMKNFLRYAQHITRECFIMHFGKRELNYLEVHEQDFAPKFARFLSTDNIEFIMETFAKAVTDIEQNGNGKIVLFDTGLLLMTKIK